MVYVRNVLSYFDVPSVKQLVCSLQVISWRPPLSPHHPQQTVVDPSGEGTIVSDPLPPSRTWSLSDLFLLVPASSPHFPLW